MHIERRKKLVIILNSRKFRTKPLRGKNIFVVVVKCCSFLGTFAKWDVLCNTQRTRILASSRFLFFFSHSCSHSFEIPFLVLALNFLSLSLSLFLPSFPPLTHTYTLPSSLPRIILSYFFYQFFSLSFLTHWIKIAKTYQR